VYPFSFFQFTSMPSSNSFRTAAMSPSTTLATVRKLLDEGIDVNWKNENGYTGLMCASAYGHVGVVKLLLDRGALIDLQSNGGGTALC
jgi:ankyrin repeat protein